MRHYHRGTALPQDVHNVRLPRIGTMTYAVVDRATGQELGHVWRTRSGWSGVAYNDGGECATDLPSRGAAVRSVVLTTQDAGFRVSAQLGHAKIGGE